MDDASALKAELRSRLKSSRGVLAATEEHRSGLAWQLARLVQAHGSTRVAAYLPYGDEPDIGEFLVAAGEQGVELIMPVSRTDGSLDWVIWNGQSAPGIFSFDEPQGEPTELSRAQLILLPALAVDQNGNRLGKGKGFYDRALETLGASGALLVAVVYDDELLPELPHEPHDRPVNFAVTPTRTVSLPA